MDYTAACSARPPANDDEGRCRWKRRRCLTEFCHGRGCRGVQRCVGNDSGLYRRTITNVMHGWFGGAGQYRDHDDDWDADWCIQVKDTRRSDLPLLPVVLDTANPDRSNIARWFNHANRPRGNNCVVHWRGVVPVVRSIKSIRRGTELLLPFGYTSE